MRSSVLGVAMLLGLCAIPAQDANAQPAPAQAPAREAIECGAGESKRKSCQADVSAGVVLVNQEGDASCVHYGFSFKGFHRQ